jgi:hypothetical protein
MDSRILGKQALLKENKRLQRKLGRIRNSYQILKKAVELYIAAHHPRYLMEELEEAERIRLSNKGRSVDEIE